MNLFDRLNIDPNDTFEKNERWIRLAPDDRLVRLKSTFMEKGSTYLIYEGTTMDEIVPKSMVRELIDLPKHG